MTREKNDGSQNYTATIRKKLNGEVVLTLTETFASERSAQHWVKMRKSELNTKGANWVKCPSFACECAVKPLLNP